MNFKHTVCGRCGETWDNHIQGRCPPEVEANTRAFAKAMLVALFIIAIVSGVCVWRLP